MIDIAFIISKELRIGKRQVANTLKLLEEDNTVPFIARYRKEATGELSEVEILKIRDRAKELENMEKRRKSILESIEEQGKLTPELKKAIEKSDTLAQLEDLYLPYKKKKRTRGMIAREKGLEKLAEMIFDQRNADIESMAAKFINTEKGVESIEDALQGASDIIAENINEDSECRAEMRSVFAKKSFMSSKAARGSKNEQSKYKDYFDFSENITSIPSHRILAIFRGVDEKELNFHIMPDDEWTETLLAKRFIRGKGNASNLVLKAMKDSYKRLLAPSLENEMKAVLKQKADTIAIEVFAENLKELLMASPLGEKRILAIDPGFRTGCKLVCIDQNGNLLFNTAIYPLEPHNKTKEAEKVIKNCVKELEIEAIAVGNGTGGRESEQFCRDIGFGSTIPVIMVNESGASVYSASETARKEFPDHDVTVRGAVSIARRLADPLSELVKIDPSSIGVGQYQHDVDQKALKESLKDVVVSCVNQVGIDLNTASQKILEHISGLNAKTAANIVEYRKEKGAFKNRKELLKVKGLGEKAFQQAAGFTRIRNGKNPLDRSAVHPESYPIVEQMAKDLNTTVENLMTDSRLRRSIKLENYTTDTVGLPTLRDIVKELEKPGLDPRDPFEIFAFREGVNHMEDLVEGMNLPGIVTNVTAFGAFVDIGVHQDGLIHISKLSDSYVSNPHDVVKVNQKVEVEVIGIDLDRKRISLAMIKKL